MKLMIKLLAIFSFCCSTFVKAEENLDNQNPWSLSILMGYSDVDLKQSNVATQDLQTLSFEVDYQFDQHFGMKFGTQSGFDLGSIAGVIIGAVFNLQIEDYSYDRYYLAATAKTEGEVHIFGSVGISRFDEKIEITNSINDLSSHTTKPFWEVGVGWEVHENFGLGISYSDSNADLAKISTYQVKFSYMF
jgi:long-subunit fatty acid transport protein